MIYNPLGVILTEQGKRSGWTNAFTKTGSGKHSYLSRSCSDMCVSGYALFYRKRQFRHVAFGAKGILSRKASVSIAPCGYSMEVLRNDRVSK